MAIAFKCPCGKRFKAKDDQAGKKFRCPQCGASIGVPQQDEPTDDQNSFSESSPLEVPVAVRSVDSGEHFLSTIATVSESEQVKATRAATPLRYPIATIVTSAIVGAFVGAGTCYWIVGSKRVSELPMAKVNPVNIQEREVQAQPAPVGIARRDEEQPQEPKQKRDPEVEILESWYDVHDLEGGVVKRIGDVDVVLGYKVSTVYVPQNASDGSANMVSFGTFFCVGYRNRGKSFADPTAGFIPINGVPQKMEFVSSEPAIVEPYEDGSTSFRVTD